ncbi:MAG: RNA methyltransferase [Clostridia bacterium]|nr:RNA methyltransferase [Clostridia bacterium]
MNGREIITSRQNKLVTLVSKLGDRKHRDSERLFVLDGIKLYAEACLCGIEMPYVLVNCEKAETVAAKLKSLGVEDAFSRIENSILTTDAVFSKISQEKSPEGIISIARYIDKLHKIITINKRDDFLVSTDALATPTESVMMLESVRDPGNLGTVIRSAYAFGIDRLVLSLDCADIYNPRTVRAAMGALFRMRIDRCESLAPVINSYRQNGRRVLGSALDKNAMILRKGELSGADIIVIGNEGHGISDSVRSACNGCIYIPMTENAESLNAAMASTVFAWEIGGNKLI